MGKLILLTEAARRLGLTDQTLRNWEKKGILRIKAIGKARYVDENTINSIQDTAEEIAHTQRRLKKLRDQKAQEAKEFMEAMHDKAARQHYYRLVVVSGIRTEFFSLVADMLQEYGSLTYREAEIMKKLLKGSTYEDIGESFGLSRERIRQIVEKSIRKSRDLTWLKERLDHIRDLETDNQSMKAAYKNIKGQLRQQEEQERKESKQDEEARRQAIMEKDEVCKLLSTRLMDCEFSARTIHCLTTGGCDFETIGDVVRLRKTDVLKIRNFGKKSLKELDDFFDTHGLQWGTDVDKVYRERFELLIKQST